MSTVNVNRFERIGLGVYQVRRERCAEDNTQVLATLAAARVCDLRASPSASAFLSRDRAFVRVCM